MQKKTVLITGGSKGIGEALVREFASRGYNVVFSYLKSSNKANNLVSEWSNQCQIIAVQTDISCKNQVERLVDIANQKFGCIDILINNAGMAQQKLFQDIPESDWNNIIETNLKSIFYTCKSVIPQMINAKSGKILNISSVWGIIGAACEVHYSTTKAAIIGFTKSLARELGPSNINVNCLAPGIIDTDMNSGLSAEEKHDLIQQIPLNRLGTPNEIASIAYFLCSDSANYITGQVLTADGGFI